MIPLQLDIHVQIYMTSSVPCMISFNLSVLITLLQVLLLDNDTICLAEKFSSVLDKTPLLRLHFELGNFMNQFHDHNTKGCPLTPLKVLLSNRGYVSLLHISLKDAQFIAFLHTIPDVVQVMDNNMVYLSSIHPLYHFRQMGKETTESYFIKNELENLRLPITFQTQEIVFIGTRSSIVTLKIWTIVQIGCPTSWSMCESKTKMTLIITVLLQLEYLRIHFIADCAWCAMVVLNWTLYESYTDCFFKL